jgi:6-phosphogluconolactonase (cycloisomerase 2 family)
MIVGKSGNFNRGLYISADSVIRGSGSTTSNYQRLGVYVAAMTRTNNKGISVYAFDESTGLAELLLETNDIDNLMFLSVSVWHNTIYATSEIFAHKEGTVLAYRFD